MTDTGEFIFKIGKPPATTVRHSRLGGEEARVAPNISLANASITNVVPDVLGLGSAS